MRDKGIGSGVEPTVGGGSEGHLDQQLADDRLTWTVPEAVRLLGISKDCAYDAARRGDLPVRVIGRRVVVPRRPPPPLAVPAGRRRAAEEERA